MPSANLPASILGAWIAEQRWYAGKGSAPRLDIIGAWELDSEPDARAVIYLVEDVSGPSPILYQIPTSQRSDRVAALEDALIAVLADEGGNALFVYDGPRDPAFTNPLLQMVVTGRTVEGAGMRASGHPIDSASLPIRSSEVLRGEQSNTSIVYQIAADANRPARSVVCKLFRALHAGVNPDVELQSALSAAGSTRVPRCVGSIAAEWRPSRDADSTANGDLVFAQEFLVGSEDAWRRALRSARTGTDFTVTAYDMGVTLADIHDTLAKTFPTESVTPAYVEGVQQSWRGRFDSASEEVPVVAEFRSALDTLYRAAGTIEWPRLQRIHGDLHLGQVLIDVDQHCVMIDFEGEPLRPMAERSRPDIGLRDIAGMLRSFDYVAGTHPEVDGIQGWTRGCRHAFLNGYIDRSGDDLRAHRLLLDAFEADKAVYEALYESRNRPGWLGIPTAAVERLAGRALEYSAGQP
jgi:maltokinase